MKAPLAALLLLGAMPFAAYGANPNHTAICTPSNPVAPEDVVITGSGYRPGDSYTVRFVQNDAPYGAGVAQADASGDISLSMNAIGIAYPVGTTDVTVNDQPGSKLRVLATCSFTAS
jgi:hypothetical protein